MHQRCSLHGRCGQHVFRFCAVAGGKNFLADPQTSRPFVGKLVNVCALGENFTLTANEEGTELRAHGSQDRMERLY